jgi:N-acetylglucosaminyldiphosphoundecaprenol N-acetyl-beta-D-mannosaminyltransferase
MEKNNPNKSRFLVLSSCINQVAWSDALDFIVHRACGRVSSFITICNVHVVASAYLDSDYGGVINASDMATPDGAPVAWFLRRLGAKKQQRINGPDLMWKYCELSLRETVEKSNIPSIYLYGGKDETLQILGKVLREKFPNLVIAGAYSPPFRPLTVEEDQMVIDDINASGAGVVWVSLGCPKQERWMAEHKGKIHAVMVGVGAAFDYHAGTLKRAPLWMQRNGLEWTYRFMKEPRRLWKRYLVTNTVFLVVGLGQLLRRRLGF